MAQTQPSNAPAPAPKRRRGRTALLGCGGFLVLVIIIIVIAAIASSGGGNSNNTSSGGSGTSTASNNGGSGSKTASLGTPVRDGKFEFTVKSVTYAKHVGGEFGETAQGRYALLHVKVRNIGGESQDLFAGNQYVYDSHGRQFTADDTASGNTIFATINPGNEVSGVIAFDMPRHDRPVKAELHDSAFSEGVTVTLP